MPTFDTLISIKYPVKSQNEVGEEVITWHDWKNDIWAKVATRNNAGLSVGSSTEKVMGKHVMESIQFIEVTTRYLIGINGLPAYPQTTFIIVESRFPDRVLEILNFEEIGRKMGFLFRCKYRE